mmetsp:Transcript_29469/g.70848  ORF Transcript_29469/g.70848 Transcript_29469/m.70848 type:complete len:184 (-) Transcript_29469:340-891(-)
MTHKGTETVILLEKEMREQMIEFALQFLTVPDLNKVTFVNRHFSKHVPSRQDVWEPILGWYQKLYPIENLDNPPTCEDMRSARQDEPSFWPRNQRFKMKGKEFPSSSLLNGSLLPPSFWPNTGCFEPPAVAPLNDPRLTPEFSLKSSLWLFRSMPAHLNPMLFACPYAFGTFLLMEHRFHYRN